MLEKSIDTKFEENKLDITKNEKAKKPNKSDFLKWFLIGMLLTSILSGCLIYLKTSSSQSSPLTGLAAYNPQKLVEGWQLTSASTNLAEIELPLKKEMMLQGVVDAAVWEFSKGKEKLYFWTRIYKDEKTRKSYDYVFDGPLAWRNGFRTNIVAGDEGIIGIYKTSGNDPLMVYIAQGKQIWYIAYYNYVNENGPAYNATNINEDKQFLVALGKEFYNSFQTS
jgi:hypothetical protein